MWEVTFSCPLCSRMFLEDRPYVESHVPRHLDPLLGTPCPGSGMSQQSVLEIPEPAHAAWPKYQPQ